MSRLQLALNVSNLDEAVEFYTKFFRTQPSKLRPGYANFAIDEPPLKLVLFENPEAPGFVTDLEDQTTCCYAVQDKVWVDGPDGSRWEVYTVLADASDASSSASDDTCCTPVSVTTPETAPCC